MSVAFYMDEHAPGPVTTGLRLRAVDVRTAQDDGREGTPDSDLLDRATELGRVLYTEDDDFLVITADRQRSGIEFAGVVYAKHQALTYRACIDNLELIAKAGEPHEYANRVEYLPL